MARWIVQQLFKPSSSTLWSAKIGLFIAKTKGFHSQWDGFSLSTGSEVHRKLRKNHSSFQHHLDLIYMTEAPFLTDERCSRISLIDTGKSSQTELQCFASWLQHPCHQHDGDATQNSLWLLLVLGDVLDDLLQSILHVQHPGLEGLDVRLLVVALDHLGFAPFVLQLLALDQGVGSWWDHWSLVTRWHSLGLGLHLGLRISRHHIVGQLCGCRRCGYRYCLSRGLQLLDHELHIAKEPPMRRLGTLCRTAAHELHPLLILHPHMLICVACMLRPEVDGPILEVLDRQTGKTGKFLCSLDLNLGQSASQIHHVDTSGVRGTIGWLDL